MKKKIQKSRISKCWVKYGFSQFGYGGFETKSVALKDENKLNEALSEGGYGNLLIAWAAG